ncbi:MAG: hypothetical protein LPK80_08745 [Bacteroidota bacterium]|nr:hypothetical protein [Bacteroidota bacterium]MDX5426528.1 hypothetical protein [Bacteroidota bacterium]
MKRIHLFEFEDLPWFPSHLRDHATEFLQFLIHHTHLFEPIVDKLIKAIDRSGERRIIDLGSGGGGPWVGLSQELEVKRPEFEVFLTDLYPNRRALSRVTRKRKNIHFIKDSVNALKVSSDLTGFRTMFLSFHHFRPEQALDILQDSVNARSGIGIFEGQERSFASILAMILSPVTVVLTTPFIRPFRWGRILFTYLIPIIPLVVLWDGVISSFRTYSVEEMKDLISKVQGHETFSWQVGKIPSGPGKISYLIGVSSSVLK